MLCLSDCFRTVRKAVVAERRTTELEKLVLPCRLTASSFRPRKVGRSLTHRSASQVCPVVSKSVQMRQSAVFLFRNDEIRGSIP